MFMYMYVAWFRPSSTLYIMYTGAVINSKAILLIVVPRSRCLLLKIDTPLTKNRLHCRLKDWCVHVQGSDGNGADNDARASRVGVAQLDQLVWQVLYPWKQQL